MCAHYQFDGSYKTHDNPICIYMSKLQCNKHKGENKIWLIVMSKSDGRNERHRRQQRQPNRFAFTFRCVCARDVLFVGHTYNVWTFVCVTEIRSVFGFVLWWAIRQQKHTESDSRALSTFHSVGVCNVGNRGCCMQLFFCLQFGRDATKQQANRAVVRNICNGYIYALCNVYNFILFCNVSHIAELFMRNLAPTSSSHHTRRTRARARVMPRHDNHGTLQVPAIVPVLYACTYYPCSQQVLYNIVHYSQIRKQ